MARLLDNQNGQTIELLAQHIIGRHPSSANTVIVNPKVSRIHATISWDGEQWLVRDSSTNGTFINGKRLIHEQEQVLAVGDHIGIVDKANDCFTVDSLESPACMLIPETAGTPLIILQNLVVLPNEQTPLLTLYQDADGLWYCEDIDGKRNIINGSKIGVLDNIWRFIEASGCAATIGAVGQTDNDNITVYFNVSQNEEHVSLSVKVGAQVFDLGERSHHYLLLLLARQRLSDKAAGISESERGWVGKEALIKALGMEETHINIQIYRLRKQIVDTLPQHLLLSHMIEKRRGYVRIVWDEIHIEGGLR